jgi:FtsP/CotA-like multicopper oxidase with cupredoxin domain
MFYIILQYLMALIYLFLYIPCLFATEPNATILQVTEKTMLVNDKKSRVFDISQPDGTFGYKGIKGQLFDVIVENKTHVPLVLHWHGIILPNDDDGVPYVTQFPIPPGNRYHYRFRLKQSGTYWLHSHYKLQEQKLMAAPLIIYDQNEKRENEAIMFIQDFTFQNPETVYADLRHVLQKKSMQPTMPMKTKSMTKMAEPDVNDVKFDAYLTNHKTLRNPDIIHVVPGELLRLRIINASSSSNYVIDLGKLNGTLIAVDGEPIHPIQHTKFQISIGNRLDIRIFIPPREGAYPILALPEGTHQQTGLILATGKAKVPHLSETTTKTNPLLNYAQERKLSALQPMKRLPVKRSLVFNLQGNMRSYRWAINGKAWPYIMPYVIKPNKRIELVFNNQSNMPHPMHFHGHVFQISEINGQKVAGRKGDTVDVMPHSTMKVIFDSNNPGIWMLHCHVLYHQMGGMMTTINYIDYPDRFTTQQRVEGDSFYSSIKKHYP